MFLLKFISILFNKTASQPMSVFFYLNPKNNPAIQQSSYIQFLMFKSNAAMFKFYNSFAKFFF